MHNARLLIMGEELASSLIATGVLAEKRKNMAIANSGAEGLHKAAVFQPDVVLLDVRVGDMSGFLICEQLKRQERFALTPIIFVTSAGSDRERLRGFESGAVEYIASPYACAEVIARITVHINYARIIRRHIAFLRQEIVHFSAQFDGDEALFQSANKLLKENIQNAPNLRELAINLSASERKLTEVFRRKVGMSVFDFLKDMRLNYAQHMLTGSDLAIQTIASAIGYQKPGDFTRAFRQHFGCTPREFRKMRGIIPLGEGNDSTAAS